VIAILDDNPADTAVMLTACWLIGAVVVPLPPSPSDLGAQQLVQSRAQIALIRSRYLPEWQFYMDDEPLSAPLQAWENLTIIQLGGEEQPDYPHFHSLVRSMPNTFFNEHPEPVLDSLAALFATTRMVPFSPQTQGSLLSASQSLATVQAITGNQRLISYLPLCGQIMPPVGSSDAVNILLSTLLVGSSLILSTVFEPHQFWREVAASRLHIACLSTKHIQDLIAHASAQQTAGKPIYGDGVYQQDIKQLRHIYCPDAPAELTRQFTRMFPFPIVTIGA
jgi:acyl-CoA synthetase (AMP-forming)/AMP-acid ligase II